MDFGALISSVTSIGQIGKALVDERDRQKLAALQIDLSNKIIEAQTQILQLLGTVVEQQRLIPVLEKRIRELEASDAEKARYQLTKLGSLREFFAYSLRPDAEPLEGTGEVSHFLCQPCFDAGKKVILTGNGEGYWNCPVCRHGAQVEPEAPISYSTGRRTFMDDIDDY
ncbi:hypothetical protein FHU10_1241 [Serratia fonticola]|uniref:Uncharacterized protein n=1 Tax=Serratia fonticola TaxID=47917 RepID=A0A559T2F5_SERFO|nr:hypothetical protein FHU09_1210 [Serratia fonticola]TQI99260.1 hypothetical protein FHU11_4842 [Serratia fonticola]TVZ68785.1 hypothetical protein FHU10_1241 [Serratia fonticola]